MKQTEEPRSLIQRNARRIAELRACVHETWKHRNDGKEACAAWTRACHEFHSQYDTLAFPGGYQSGLKRIQAGDVKAIEDAVSFLELRPFFPRSQYMAKKLRQLLKRAPLTRRQEERFQAVLAEERERKARWGGAHLRGTKS